MLWVILLEWIFRVLIMFFGLMMKVLCRVRFFFGMCMLKVLVSWWVGLLISGNWVLLMVGEVLCYILCEKWVLVVMM